MIGCYINILNVVLWCMVLIKCLVLWMNNNFGSGSMFELILIMRVKCYLCYVIYGVLMLLISFEG